MSPEPAVINQPLADGGQVGIKAETNEQRKAASQAWVLLKDKTKYEAMHMYADGAEKFKIRKVSYFVHRLAKNKTVPTKVSRSLAGVYKKVKGRWIKTAGNIPIERLSKLTGLSLP